MLIKFPHKSTKEAAIIRVKNLLEENREKIAENASDVKAEWKDNVLSYAQGQSIQGTLTVTETDFELYAKLPLALRLFEGTIQRMMESEIQKLHV